MNPVNRTDIAQTNATPIVGKLDSVGLPDGDLGLSNRSVAAWKRAAIVEACLVETAELLGWTPPTYVVVHVRHGNSASEGD